MRRPTLLLTCLFPHVPLPWSLLPVLLCPLLVLSLLFVLLVSGVSLRRGLFIGMLRSLLSWRPPLGLPPLSLLPSISLTFSSLLLKGLVWVRWWLQVLWCRVWFLVCFLYRYSYLASLLFFAAGVECPWGEHSPLLACSCDGSSLGAVRPLGLRVALTPLYGS